MAGKDLVGELLFACDEIVNTLLHRAPADELVDEHVLLLADAKGAVRCLVLDRRVPPPVEVDDMGRGGQVEPGARKVRLIGRPLMRPPAGRN